MNECIYCNYSKDGKPWMLCNECAEAILDKLEKAKQ